jgi:CRISPR-associated protein Csb1
VQFARQIAVLSLPALRRLRFPLRGRLPEEQRNADAAARTTLAALGLAAIARQWAAGFSLRSRCELVPRGELVFSLLSPGYEERFTVSPESAARLLQEAAQESRAAGLSWPTHAAAGAPWKDGCLTLKPNKELAKAVAESRRLAAEKRE